MNCLTKALHWKFSAFRIFAMLGFPAMVQAQFAYLVTNNTISIAGYTGPGGTIVIPSSVNGLPVTGIENGAFRAINGVDTVIIPTSVTKIGAYAFNECSLTNVVVPDSVTNLGVYAFSGCTHLLDTRIGNKVPIIDSSTFSDCIYMTNIVIGDGVTSIGPNAFFDCPSLKSISLPASLTNLSDSAFAQCNELESMFFKGNSPSATANAFYLDNYLTLFYLSGSTGWGPFLANRPAVLWNPAIQAPQPFSVSNNVFNFTITGSPSMPVAIEATTDLAKPWTPLQTVTLSTNGNFLFVDNSWLNRRQRFFRLNIP